MDRKTIIDEGLLELYLLGELTPEEENSLLAIIEKDEDLRAIYDDLELAFEKVGMDNGIVPPISIKEALRTKLPQQTKILHQQNQDNQRKYQKTFSSRFLMAASVALLFGLSTIWFYGKWRQSVEMISSLSFQTAVLEERLNQLETNYQLTSNKYEAINNPQITPLVLLGNGKSPKSRVVFYVNHEEETVLVNAQGLPQLGKNNTYQLWADVEGEMINMGLLSTDEDLIPAIYIDKAESFNITVEPAGGNDHPTVQNLIGNIYL